jgi:hypothetical protein
MIEKSVELGQKERWLPTMVELVIAQWKRPAMAELIVTPWKELVFFFFGGWGVEVGEWFF